MGEPRHVLAPVLILALLAPGCGREEPQPEGPIPWAVNVMADTGRSERLHIQKPAPTQIPPSARVWLAQVSPSRPPPLDPALPVPSPELVEPAHDPPRLQVDEDLKPPLLQKSGTLVPPSGRHGTVELDVRVTEEGEVSDALYAGGSTDSLLIAAAVSCALDMRFYPALQGGRPVAVWCRQRFDFGDRR